MEQPQVFKPDSMFVGESVFNHLLATREGSPPSCSSVRHPAMALVYDVATELAPLSDDQVRERALDLDNNVPKDDPLAVSERNRLEPLISMYEDRIQRYQSDPNTPDGQAEPRAMEILREDVASRLFRLTYLRQFDKKNLPSALKGDEIKQGSVLAATATAAVWLSLLESSKEPETQEFQWFK